MKLYLKLTIAVLLMAGVLVSKTSSLAESTPARGQQLQGEAAREFLAREGILDQLRATLMTTPIEGRNFEEPVPMTASDAATGDGFGYSVAVEGDTAVVGAYLADVDGKIDQGAAYIFSRGDTTWSQQQRLVATDGVAGDEFGVSVAVAGDTVAVGAYKADVGGNADQGAAYIFTRDGSTWGQQQKLVDDDGAAGDRFGWSVTVDGDTAVVGAPWADVAGNSKQGTAFVFTRNDTSWIRQQKLASDDGTAGDLFGRTVAVDDDTAVLGAYQADVGGNANQGAAYVFIHSGSTWSQQQKLVAGDGAADDGFSASVAVDGDTAVVGALWADVGGNLNQGAAYVFTRSDSVWSQQQKLAADDGAGNDSFGVSVAVDGATAVVGAQLADVGAIVHQGAAYVFTRDSVTWSQQQKLVAGGGAAEDRFGGSVAIDGDTVIIGAYQADVGGYAGAGKVYLAQRGPVPWTLTDSNVANDGETFDQFGISVAVDGDIAIVGAPGVDVEGNIDQGVAYIFIRSSMSWNQEQRLVASDGAFHDHFGASVAVDGYTVVVGASGDDVGGNANQGAAYIFTSSGSAWSQQQKLTASDGFIDDHFGSVVAVDGDTAVVGARLADAWTNFDQGAAYVFTRTNTTWSQQQKLTANDGTIFDHFGSAVAVDGDTAVVGAEGADVSGNGNRGAAYVFIRSGGVWSQQQRLLAGDGAGGDRFGRSVSVDGDTVVVGAWLADVGGNGNQGAAYVFTRNNTIWSQQQKLLAGDGAGGHRFGSAVVVDGDTAVVGAASADVAETSTEGVAYVFTRSGSVWSHQQKLLAGDGAAGHFFGFSVAMSGDTAIVGAPWADLGGNDDRGTGYVFTRSDSTWNQQQKLLANNGSARDYFGWAVALDGDTAVVGAYLADVRSFIDQGAAYVFTGSDGAWNQQQKLVADDGDGLDRFGISVAIDDDTAVVGAYQANVNGNVDQGAAYVFTRSDTTWSQQQKLVAGDGTAGDEFGRAVAVDGDMIVVGTPSVDVGGEGAQGTAYVFSRSGSTWVQQQKLLADDGAGGDQFGISVAAAGETIVIGAWLADVGGNYNQGAAYVFTRGSSAWSQQQKLVAGDGAATDRFGTATAVSSDTAVVGAYWGDVEGRIDQGAAYVFTQEGATWSQQQKLVAGDGATGDEFGWSVAVDGDTVVVGAQLADVGGKVNQGAVYAFVRSGSAWSWQQKLLAGDGTVDDLFGGAVAVTGNTVAVGARLVDVTENSNQGRVYFFERQRLTQTIDFPLPIGGTEGYFVNQTVTLAATADSGLPVSYGSDTPDICTVSADTATLLAAGQCSIIAFQAGNAIYAPAEAIQTFTVQRLTQTIDFPLPASDTGGYYLNQTVTLSATADSGLLVSYRSDTPDICTVSDSIATLLAIGQCTITAFQSGNDVYAPAEAIQSFTITLYSVYLPLTVR